jgi:hypothetical protein
MEDDVAPDRPLETTVTPHEAPPPRPFRPLPSLAALCALPALAGAQLVFEPPLPSDGGPYAVRTLVADLDGDRFPDALTGHFLFGPGDVTLSRGSNDGAFGAPEPLDFGGAGRQPRRLADFDEDGRLDVLTIGGGVPPLNVAVLLGDGRGGFGPPLGLNSAHENPIDADVGDFDGDGHLDVVFFNEGFGFSAGSLEVVFGNGDGSFDAPVAVEASHFDGFAATHVMRVGDVTGDGLDDIVYTTGSLSNPTWISQGDGSFHLAACAGSCNPIIDRDFVLADMDGDGRQDAVTPRNILLATPEGTFQLSQFVGSAFVPFVVGVGDLDGDGLADVAVGRNGTASAQDPELTLGDVMVYRGLGDGTVQLPGVQVSHVAQPRWVAFADADLDGRTDLVVAKLQSGTDTLATLRNHTYAPDSPWLDVGHALAGGNGAPILLADGSLVGGEPCSVRLANGLPNGFAKLFIGLSPLFAPFKQGVMVPTPTLFLGPLPLDATGAIALAGLFPAGASGATLWMQWWLPHSGGPAGWAASSGVRAQVP